MSKVINFATAKENRRRINTREEEIIKEKEITKDITLDEFIENIDNLFAGTDDDTDVIVFTIR